MMDLQPIARTPSPALTGVGLAAVLVTVAMLAPVAVRAQSDAAFEAAVRASASRPAPPRASVASGGRTYRAPPGYVVPTIAPPATLPASYRVRPVSWDGWQAARRAANAGEIDPAAWMTYHLGPLPLPPGATALRCGPNGDLVRFSLGTGSAEFQRVLDARFAQAKSIAPSLDLGQVRIGRGGRTPASDAAPQDLELMRFHFGAVNIPETLAMLRQAVAFLRARGFVPFGSPGYLANWRRADAAPGALAYTIRLIPSPVLHLGRCHSRGIPVPSGPLIEIGSGIAEPGWTAAIHTTFVEG